MQMWAVPCAAPAQSWCARPAVGGSAGRRLQTFTGAAKASSPASSSAGAGTAPLPKLLGNWENADGSVKLEFQSAGKCYISFGPMTGSCSYAPAATGVTVTFDGEPLRLLANPDGSLSSAGDGDAMMSIRLKRR